ncbi:MAG: Mrp/NBP35 family ATP-binding protein [Campylobacterales bacterium]
MQKPITYGTFQKPNDRASFAKKIIAVTSGKGGVGKSTVAANISASLALEGYKVGLLDADIYGPNIPRVFGLRGELIRWGEKKMLPLEKDGVKIMSVASTLKEDDAPIVWRSSVAVSALIQFLEDVEWGELDYFIIDMPPGTGDVQITMLQEVSVDISIVVTTPQEVAADDVKRAVRMLQESGVEEIALVENMSYFIGDDGKRYDIFGKGAGEEISQRYSIPLIANIPIIIEARELGDRGKVASLHNDEFKKIYKETVSKIVEL